jgi:putative ABC transport system permease protein
MFRLTRRSLWEHKRRLVSTIVAIVLGVGFMAGTLVLSDTVGRTFDDLFAKTNESIDAQVQGTSLFSDDFGGLGDQRNLLSPSLVDEVRGVDGVDQADGYVITVGFGASNRVLGKDGKPVGSSQGPPTLLESWHDPDLGLSAYKLTKGRGPEADDELALNVAAVEDGDLEVGDQVRVLTQFGLKEYRLVGEFLFGSAKSSAGAVSADFTLREAQRLAGIGDQVQQVVASARPGVSQQELVSRIQPLLPKTAEVITGVEAGEQLSDDVTSGFSFFSTMLQVFGAIALLVGVFVISNTFSILVAQRTRELALLRAVGATRRQILGSVLLEASMIGAFAAAVGLGVGLLLARGIVAAFSAFGADLPADGLAVKGGTIVIAFVIGIGVTLVASLVPAIRSTRVRPLAALRESAIERTGASKARIVVGILILLLGALQLSNAWKGDDADLGVVGMGAVLIIVAAIVIGPVLASPTIRAMGVVLPRFRGITGKLATENAARSPKRTSATASALLIGVALVSFITVLASSAKASVTEAVERGFHGDFVVQSSAGAFGPPSPFPSDVADQVAALPGVAATSGLGFSTAQITYPDGESGTQFLTAVDPTTLGEVITPKMAEGKGKLTDLTDQGVLVDAHAATRHDVKIGDRVEVLFPGGKVAKLRVQAVSDEPTLFQGYTITRNTFIENTPSPGDVFLFGKMAKGAQLDDVLKRVDKVIKDIPTVEVVDRDEYIGDLARQITQFVTVIYVLLALSVIIAVIGIGNTLSLSIHERTRELGLLRAVGMNRKQLRASIRWEAVLISVLGTLVGLVLGLVLSKAVIEALGSNGLSTFKMPVVGLVRIVILAFLLGWVASIRPSRRASRMAILDAIATS